MAQQQSSESINDRSGAAGEMRSNVNRRGPVRRVKAKDVWQPENMNTTEELSRPRK